MAMQSRLTRWTLGLIALISAATPALAEDVTVERNVTVRQDASRNSPAVTYPAIGTRLELLDDGHRTGNYYHVRLPDGRTGWVDWFNNYRLFGPIGHIPPAEAEANYYAAIDNLDMVA